MRLLKMLKDKLCVVHETAIPTSGIRVLKLTPRGAYRGNTVRVTEMTYLFGVIPIRTVRCAGYIVTSTPEHGVHPDNWEIVKGSNYLDIGTSR